MFRRHRPDADVVLAARRRLDQLSAELAATSAGSDRPSRPPGDRVTAHHADAAATTAPARSGYHARRRRSGQQGFSRWAWSTDQVAVTVAILIMLVAVTGWMWWRSRPHVVPVATRDTSIRTTVPVSGSTPPPATGSAGVPGPSTGGTTPTLIVDVEGKVRRPGIVELAQGSRVVDAIEAAGGGRPGVSLRSLNLARLLVDGEQILVGVRPASIGPLGGEITTAGSPSTAVSTAPAPMDLNSATQTQLEELPGIGPVTASAIISWRAQNGRFTTVDELLEVSGIGDATLADIRAFVYV